MLVTNTSQVLDQKNCSGAKKCASLQRPDPSRVQPKVDAFVIRRRAFVLSGISTALALHPPETSANVLEEYVERSQRPTMTSEQAVVKLLDARGILYELKELAKTNPKSDERFQARKLLPGMAKSLRQVGMAAPVLVATVTGSDKRSSISKEYGGKSLDAAAAKADPVYNAIGQIITISGRTIRKEAQASPSFAENAIVRINDLLDLMPQQKIDEAQEIRKARRIKTLIKREDVPLNAIAS